MRKQTGILLIVVFSLLVSFGFGVVKAADIKATMVIEGYVSLPEGSAPGGLLSALDGEIWVTGLKNGQIFRINSVLEMDGVSLAADGTPYDMLIGTDRNVWVSDPTTGELVQIDRDTNEVLNVYLAGLEDQYKPTELAINRDQSIWFTNFDQHRLGKLTRHGEIKSFDFDHDVMPLGITTDRSGNIWFTDWGNKQIGKVLKTDESVVYYALSQESNRPTEILRDQSDGLWFIYDNDTAITYVDVDGVMTTTQITSSSNALMDISIGGDGNLWYLGTSGIGFCEISYSQLVNCQETNFDSPVFEGEGRSTLISGGDGYMYFTRLDRDAIYRVQSGTNLKDLQLSFYQMSDYVLYGGEFSATLNITNWSAQPASDAILTISLPDQVYFDSVNELASEDCTQVDQNVICQLQTIAANQNQILEVNFHSEQSGVSGEEKELLFEVSHQAMDYLSTNNQIERRFPVLTKFQYFNDFSNAAEPELWSMTSISQPADDLTYLGQFDNDNVNIVFDNLPKHDEVKNCFDLYVNGTWDGEQYLDPNDPENVVGPDIWAYYMDENAILITTYSNQAAIEQNFPDAYHTETHPAQSGAKSIGDFNGDGIKNDALYQFCYTLPHQGDTLKLTYYGVNLTGEQGETWGIDDVLVEIYYHNAFNWLYLPLIMQ